jgi:hypothetical protein
MEFFLLHMFIAGKLSHTNTMMAMVPVSGSIAVPVLNA